MASAKEYLDFVLEQLSGLDEVSFRAMMGEYILYYRGRVFGGIYDDMLLVKPVPANEELDSATLINAYNEYRRRHKFLLPEEIRRIREQYGLSQRSFAKLLNWGDKTIRRYENGAVQDRAHNSLLLFLREPENMRAYLTENEVALDEKQISRLLETVEKLEQDTDFRVGRRYFDLFFSRVPCEENGFKGFDYEKLCAMVLFFAHKSAGLLKTKLMKLFNYSDMIFYKENGLSISGLKYAHLPYGPVPDNFDMILGKMKSSCRVLTYSFLPFMQNKLNGQKGKAMKAAMRCMRYM